MLGIGQFLLIYFGSALTASLVHLSYNYFYHPRNPKRYIGSLGASGSLMALTTIYALTFPSSTFLIFFLIPAPAIMVVGLYAFYDIYRAASRSIGNTDSASHIGGSLFGLIYYWYKIRGGGRRNNNAAIILRRFFKFWKR
ncbi:5799_t:CDS:2 [Diversispora eburnea]|uniref:5799_t:CDS:1 n=1 Tax=Diversispora eburnea TaxID=1213867 RepID=A0A9N8ZPA5_9GLOM|nr:5799_t:CDS:2 [Diversispora eburnea]